MPADAAPGRPGASTCCFRRSRGVSTLNFDPNHSRPIIGFCWETSSLGVPPDGEIAPIRAVRAILTDPLESTLSGPVMLRGNPDGRRLPLLELEGQVGIEIGRGAAAGGADRGAWEEDPELEQG